MRKERLNVQPLPVKCCSLGSTTVPRTTAHIAATTVLQGGFSLHTCLEHSVASWPPLLPVAACCAQASSHKLIKPKEACGVFYTLKARHHAP